MANSPDGKGTSVSNTSAGLFVSDLREPTATPFVDIVSFEGVQDEMLVRVRCLVLSIAGSRSRCLRTKLSRKRSIAKVDARSVSSLLLRTLPNSRHLAVYT